MKLKRIWIDNYKEFRRTFENDKDADFVMKNLTKEAEKMIENNAFNFTISAAYDEDGDALFDLNILKILPNNEVIINVQYTGTAK